MWEISAPLAAPAHRQHLPLHKGHSALFASALQPDLATGSQDSPKFGFAFKARSKNY